MAKVIAWTQAYNAERTLRRAMESILNQTFNDLEYYVLDNGSEDKTYEIIMEYAKNDSRVIPIHVDKNNFYSSHEYMKKYLKNTSADWFFWCDADDEYVPDFLENSINFAETENLELVAGGYEQIDALTGNIIKRRALENNMILSGEKFEKEFIQYRGFTIGGWAKLISISKMYKLGFAEKDDKYKFYGDCNWGLQLFNKCKRVGIYKDSVYKYYIYPNSLSKKMTLDFFDGYDSYWNETKKYIQSYGPISKINEDFLYAIYFSLIEERLNLVFNAPLEYNKKIFYIEHIFNKEPIKELFSRNVDPQFRNLSQRKKLIDEVKKWVTDHSMSITDKNRLSVLLLKLDTLSNNIKL